jgi:hypothetical protein
LSALRQVCPIGNRSDGLRALSRQLVLYDGRGINSVEKIISTWAPASDNNNTAAYIQLLPNGGDEQGLALKINDPQTMRH